MEQRNKMRKRILMLNYPTEIEGNWGCKASCKGLKKIVEEKYPGCLIRAHPMHFRTPSMEIPRDPGDFEQFITNLATLEWEGYPDFEWADIVILDGEGSIHEFSEKKNNDFAYLKLINIYAAKKFFGKQTMIVNHTIEFKTVNING
jgi:hypothetical protein